MMEVGISTNSFGNFLASSPVPLLVSCRDSLPPLQRLSELKKRGEMTDGSRTFTGAASLGPAILAFLPFTFPPSPALHPIPSLSCLCSRLRYLSVSFLTTDELSSKWRTIGGDLPVCLCVCVCV
jgi:hypothetical protein